MFVPNPTCSPSRRDGMPNVKRFGEFQLYKLALSWFFFQRRTFVFA